MRARLFPLLALLLLLAFPARADIIVIVHPDSPLKSLSRREVSDLYLGRPNGNGTRPLVLDQPRDSELRERFYSLLNGMNLSRVNAYWARLQFSGDTQPPAQLPDSRNIVNIVSRNRLAIGYIDSTAISDGVHPLLSLK